jgi:ketosteroid isomerase-like protein
MSEETLDVVRRFYENWSSENLDGLLECSHAEIEFDWSASRSPFRGVYLGHEGFRRFWIEQGDVWEEFRLEIVEAIEIGRDRVVTVTVARGRGQESGISLEGRGAVLWDVRDGKVLRGKLFQSREEALEAAGLSEQDAQD